MAKFSLEEVSKNNGKEGKKLWMIVKNNVYDATSFVNEHPGGTDHILAAAGRDATKDFNNVGHSGDANEILKKLKIGEVRLEDKQTNRDGKNENAGTSGVA